MSKNDYRPELPGKARKEIAPLLRFLKSSKCRSLEKRFFHEIPFLEQSDGIREVVYDDWELRGYYPMMSWWWDNYHSDLYYDLTNYRWVSFDGDNVYGGSPSTNSIDVYSCPEEWVYQNTLYYANIDPSSMPLDAAVELMKAIGKPALASKLRLELEKIQKENKIKKEEQETQARLEEAQAKQEEEKLRKKNQLKDRILGAGLGFMAAGIAGVKCKRLEPHFGKLLVAGPALGYSAVRAYQHYKNRKRK